MLWLTFPDYMHFLNTNHAQTSFNSGIGLGVNVLNSSLFNNLKVIDENYSPQGHEPLERCDLLQLEQQSTF